MFRSSGLDFVKLMRVHYALVRKQKLCDSEIVLTKSGTSEVNSFYFWHSCCEAKHFGGWIVKATCVLFHYPAFTIIDISSLNKFVAGSRRLGNGRLSYGQLCIVLFDYLFQFWRSTFTETFIPHINILPAKKILFFWPNLASLEISVIVKIRYYVKIRSNIVQTGCFINEYKIDCPVYGHLNNFSLLYLGATGWDKIMAQE